MDEVNQVQQVQQVKEVKEDTSGIDKDKHNQLYIAIEKYLMLIMIEFKDHIQKYQKLYENVKKI